LPIEAFAQRFAKFRRAASSKVAHSAKARATAFRASNRCSDIFLFGNVFRQPGDAIKSLLSRPRWEKPDLSIQRNRAIRSDDPAVLFIVIDPNRLFGQSAGLQNALATRQDEWLPANPDGEARKLSHVPAPNLFISGLT